MDFGINRNPEPTGLASWIAMKHLLLMLRELDVVDQMDVVQLLAAAKDDIEGDWGPAKAARELLEEEVRSTLQPGRRTSNP
jgi:hypothetical protein